MSRRSELLRLFSAPSEQPTQVSPCTYDADMDPLPGEIPLTNQVRGTVHSPTLTHSSQSDERDPDAQRVHPSRPARESRPWRLTIRAGPRRPSEGTLSHA